MGRRIILSEKGFSFVELLVTFVIFSMISVLVIGYLISSINNYHRVSEEVALHDEANYVMSQFINYIFVATDVQPAPGSPSLIQVTDFEGNTTTLGFDNNKAVINDKVIHSSNYSILSSGSKITIKGDQVEIVMVIQNDNSKYGKKLALDSEVSFVNVEK